MNNRTGYFYIICIISIFFLLACTGEKRKEENPEIQYKTVYPNIKYGFNFDEYRVIEDEVKENWTLSHIFAPYHIPQYQINIAAQNANVDGLKYINKGDQFYMLCDSNSTDSIPDVKYCIYVKNAVDYYVFDFNDSKNSSVCLEQKKVDTIINEIGGIIKDGSNLSSVLQSLTSNIEVSYELVEEVAGIYSWSVDFFKLMPNDKLKIVYEELQVDSIAIGIGKIKAIVFNHRNKDLYAIRFSSDSTDNYYDLNGRGLRNMFLQAPLKYTRISSSFAPRRFHPVQKRWKAHLGTDYAAPHGTPIWSTADGVVSRSGYTGGNGNFVKVKHNETYSTQYLHMSKRAVKVGDYVKQGDIIGYVGSTGLATGPHVCYRFWKNGKQINHREEKFNQGKSLNDSLKPQFLKVADSLNNILQDIPYQNDNIENFEKNSQPHTADSALSFLH